MKTKNLYLQIDRARFFRIYLLNIYLQQIIYRFYLFIEKQPRKKVQCVPNKKSKYFLLGLQILGPLMSANISKWAQGFLLKTVTYGLFFTFKIWSFSLTLRAQKLSDRSFPLRSSLLDFLWEITVHNYSMNVFLLDYELFAIPDWFYFQIFFVIISNISFVLQVR